MRMRTEHGRWEDTIFNLQLIDSYSDYCVFFWKHLAFLTEMQRTVLKEFFRFFFVCVVCDVFFSKHNYTAD